MNTENNIDGSKPIFPSINFWDIPSYIQEEEFKAPPYPIEGKKPSFSRRINKNQVLTSNNEQIISQDIDFLNEIEKNNKERESSNIKVNSLAEQMTTYYKTYGKKMPDFFEEKAPLKEEIYINYNELADALTIRELTNKYNKYDEEKMIEEYTELLEVYKNIILKNGKNNNK